MIGFLADPPAWYLAVSFGVALIFFAYAERKREKIPLEKLDKLHNDFWQRSALLGELRDDVSALVERIETIEERICNQQSRISDQENRSADQLADVWRALGDRGTRKEMDQVQDLITELRYKFEAFQTNQEQPNDKQE